MIKKINNQKGATSITWVVMIFISTIIIGGFMGIMNKTLAINEVQGIMDMSGVMALRYAVDEPTLRSEERLLVDTTVAKNKFVELIDKNISDYTGSGRMLKGYNIDSVSVLRDDQTAVGSIQGKDEYFLEAVITASYDVTSIIDGATISAVKYFDFLWSEDRASVSVSDVGGDGEGNVIIRTVSRLALR